MVRSVLLALFGLTITAPLATAADEPPPLRADFRGKPFDEKLFVKVVGRKTIDDERIRIDPQGLRVTLPAGPATPLGEYGLQFRFRIKGDFEITSPYDLLEAELAQAPAVGVAIYIQTESANGSAMMFGRFNRRGRGSNYEANRGITVDGQRQFTGSSLPGQAKNGKLRLLRRGSELTCLVVDGDGDIFVEVDRLPDFGPEDVIFARIAGQKNGHSDATFDARFPGLEIQSPSSFDNNGTPLYPLDLGVASKPSWFANSRSGPLLMIGIAVAAVVLLLALWRWRRRSGEDHPAQIEPAAVAFMCPGCNKELKAKPELAGTTIKCPHCSTAAAVPTELPEVRS